jgi:hypothetical protein
MGGCLFVLGEKFLKLRHQATISFKGSSCGSSSSGGGGGSSSSGSSSSSNRASRDARGLRAATHEVHTAKSGQVAGKHGEQRTARACRAMPPVLCGGAKNRRTRRQTESLVTESQFHCVQYCIRGRLRVTCGLCHRMSTAESEPLAVGHKDPFVPLGQLAPFLSGRGCKAGKLV